MLCTFLPCLSIILGQTNFPIPFSSSSHAHTFSACRPSFHSLASSFCLQRRDSFSTGALKRGALMKARTTASAALAMAGVIKLPWRFLFVLIVALHQLYTVTCLSEAELLIQFKGSLQNTGALSNWDPAVPPCEGDKEKWSGVLCLQGHVWGLKLEHMGLKGEINLDPLTQLVEFRTISLMNNEFEGPLPEVNKLGALKSLYFSNNKFSGDIPEDMFSGMMSLKKVHLSHNQFSGEIPMSLAQLPKLIELMIEGNKFSGPIPPFSQERLGSVNFTDNKLEGPIPAVLHKANKSSFSGNAGLCGAPLEECSPEGPKLSVATIIVVAIAIVLAVGAIIAAIIILGKRKRAPEQEETLGGTATPQGPNTSATEDLDKMEKGTSPPKRVPEAKKGDPSIKLSFLREDVEKFDLPDLLKASAEVLGSGTFGSTYKAALSSTGPVMVVKRYRHMNNVSKEEFHEHMRRLGNLNHPNVLPVVAFYYRKEEKLFVSSYVENVSLAVQLHGNKSRGRPSPDWPTRLKIVKGVSRGLLYLYNALPSLVAPHGHIKSSNVILTATNDAMLGDYGLLPIVNLQQAQEQMIAYKSPEYKQNGRITKKTDVWSLGVLILEILTGKFPSNFLQQVKGNDTDLATWVRSVFKDEWTTEVFDKDMMGTKNSEGEMIKLLKIALTLCEEEIDKRWDIKETVDRIEEIKERDDGCEDFLSSYTSETDMRSSRGLSEDFINLPMDR